MREGTWSICVGSARWDVERALAREERTAGAPSLRACKSWIQVTSGKWMKGSEQGNDTIRYTVQKELSGCCAEQW